MEAREMELHVRCGTLRREVVASNGEPSIAVKRDWFDRFIDLAETEMDCHPDEIPDSLDEF